MSCLFKSIGKLIQLETQTVRHIICNYLEKNGLIMEDMETKDILQMENDNYIKNMRQNSTWGGAIEIQAACNIWRLIVKVHDCRQNEIMTFYPVTETQSIRYKLYICWSGNHYTPKKIKSV